MQLRMTPAVKTGNDFAGSLYRLPCPECGAEPFCWCRSKNGTCLYKPHLARHVTRPERLGFHKKATFEKT